MFLINLKWFWRFFGRFGLADGAGTSDSDEFSSDFVVWNAIFDSFQQQFVIPGSFRRFPEVPVPRSSLKFLEI